MFDVAGEIALMIINDPVRHDFADICYQFDISHDELMAKADKICEDLMTFYAYADVQRYSRKDGDGNVIDTGYYFRVITELPSLYVYTHKRSQTIGVVQAFSLEDAKRKIREKSNLTEEPDEIVEVDGDLYEESV